MDQLVSMLLALVPAAAQPYLVLLGTVLLVADAVIYWTPGTADDAAYAKVKLVPGVASVVEAIQKLSMLVKKA